MTISRTIKSVLAYYVANEVREFDLTLGQMSWIKNERATRKLPGMTAKEKKAAKKAKKNERSRMGA